MPIGSGQMELLLGNYNSNRFGLPRNTILATGRNETRFLRHHLIKVQQHFQEHFLIFARNMIHFIISQ